jgi:hypothetical protein
MKYVLLEIMYKYFLPDIELHPDMNREEGFSLSRSWKALTEILNGHRKALP